MIKASDFENISYQAVVFTPDLQFNVNRVLAALVEEYSDLFNGDPVVLPPFPADAPKEIPRVILKNSDESQKLQVAISRLDVFWSRNYLENPIVNIDDFVQEVNRIFSFYRSITSARFGRLAFVVTRSKISEKPGKELTGHFCKPEWLDNEAKVLNRPDGFELHAFKRYVVDTELPKVNSWIRHKTAVVKANHTTPINVILVEQDMNTPQEQLEISDLESERSIFFSKIPNEMDIILSRYYPEGNK